MVTTLQHFKLDYKIYDEEPMTRMVIFDSMLAVLHAQLSVTTVFKHLADD